MLFQMMMIILIPVLIIAAGVEVLMQVAAVTDLSSTAPQTGGPNSTGEKLGI